VTKLIETEMVERDIFTTKLLYYNKKVTYEYDGTGESPIKAYCLASRTITRSPSIQIGSTYGRVT
jgi:hypothetical protein